MSKTTFDASSRLYTSAAAILRETDLDLDRATPKYVSLIKSDEALLTALARHYLTGVAADIRNTAATAKQAEAVEATDPRIAEALDMRVGSHPSTMAAEADKADAVQATDPLPYEALGPVVGGLPVSLTAATAEQAQAAKATDHDGFEAQRPDVGGQPSTRPAMPTAEQRAAERRLSRSTSLFDTWKMHSGRPIGNIFVHEINDYRSYSVDHAKLYVDKSRQDIINDITFKLIAEHVGPNVNQMARLRTVINEATLKRLRKKAEKEADLIIAQMKAIIPVPTRVRSVA